MITIGERIKNLRLELGITQLELAEYVGCSGQVISNLERSYTKPKTEVLNKIAEYFSVTSDYLLGITPSRWIPSNPYVSDNQLAFRIKNLIKEHKIDEEIFIEKAELEPELLDSIYSGSIKPNIDTLARISSVLDTSIDYLIGNTPYSATLKTEDEQDLLLYFRNMTKQKRRILMGEIEKLNEN